MRRTMSLAPVGWAMPVTGVEVGVGVEVGCGVPEPGDPVGAPVAAGLQATVATATGSGRAAAGAGRAETGGREVVMARETTVDSDRFPVTTRTGVRRPVRAGGEMA